MIDFEFHSSPAVSRSYGAALKNAMRGNQSGEAPSLARARVEPISIDRERARAYDALCGFERGSTLALIYPHIMAFGLQMAIMTHRQFPLSILGLIHTHNRIRRYRLINDDERLSITVRIDNWRDLKSGREFDIDTCCYAADEELVWTERSTMRSVRRSGARRSGSDMPPPELAFARLEEWSMPANLGRRYARVAGDYNPIHLGVLPARLFGFKRAIATGMWLQARAASALVSNFGYDAVETTIAFKKPVPLPAGREFVVDERGHDGVAFGLVDRTSGVVHVRGTHTPFDPSATDFTKEADNADS